MTDKVLLETPTLKLIERTDGYGDTEILIVNGKGFENTVWMDMWQCDCPEDMTWSRTIRDVFMLAFDMGKTAR